MKCPFCDALDTKVVDTRLAADGLQVRRRRECLTCHTRFTTFEQPELIMPMIVKSSGARQPFSDAKLRSGMDRALEKRPVSTTAVEDALNHIKYRLRSLGEREIPSREIGRLVMEELKKLDAVAYIRFASVYLSFSDLKDFGDEIAKLQQNMTEELHDEFVKVESKS